MIDAYRGLAVFESVASLGSFSAAARRLRLSTSVVSHHVSRLEQRLGAPLFYRSTRSLSLTPEGQKILPAARRLVAAGTQALDLLTDDTEQPTGALRIAMPAFGGHEDVQTKIWEFARLYPGVSITTNSSDRPVDLIKDGFDLAIRLGTLADSGLKSRRVGSFQRTFVASPDYVNAHAPITTIEDLVKCDFIAFAMLSPEIELECGPETRRFTPEIVRLEVDSVSAAKSAILRGLGVQRLPHSEVKTELENGDLLELLPNWRAPELGVFVVWPDISPEKKLTRLLIDFLA